MATDTVSGTTPPLLRFLDSFLQERNIKWVLALGTLILLASSCMLVAANWSDYTPLWQYLIMLAYTGLFHLAGQWSFHKLNLRKTGTVLMALTVLLIPALFFALHWVQNAAGTQTISIWAQLPNLLSLVVTLLLASLAAKQIFRHFLRSTQPTFIAAYLILCTAAALAPALPSTLAIVVSLLLWAVFAGATLKVNRHVFWLGEEQQLPRIFGFFPIALLGTLFLAIFAINFSTQIALEWLGLGALLVAIPVLLTSDTAAQVFQQRTGGLEQRFPAAVMLPMLVGLILCVAGVVMSGAGLLPGHSPLAITPTAAAAGLIMFLLARRTQKAAFVWALLVLLVITYNFAPFFFQELARSLLTSSATAVQEAKLPYAFYGLSYLPLIAIFMTASIIMQRRGNEFFSMPLQSFSIGLAVLLWLVAFSHSKAIFPVSIVMTAIFALQAMLYKKRELAALTILAWLAAMTFAVAFCRNVLGLPVSSISTTYLLAANALLLMIPGFFLDRRIALLPTIPMLNHQPSRYCQIASLAVTVTLTGLWFVQMAFGYSVQFIPLLFIIALLVMHALRWLQPWFSSLVIAFVYTSIAICLEQIYRLDLFAIVASLTIALSVQWLLRYGFSHWPQARLSRAFSKANHYFSSIGLWLLVLVIYVPWAGIEVVFHAFLGADEVPWWSCRLLMVLWLIDAIRHYRRAWTTVICYSCLLILSSALLVAVMQQQAWLWLPTLWVAIAGCSLLITESLQRRQQVYPGITRPVTVLAQLVFASAAILSLVIYQGPVWIAGGLASVGFLSLALLRQQIVLKARSLALINWQLLVLVLIFFSPARLFTLADLSTNHVLSACLPVAFAAALSAWLWHHNTLIARLQYIALSVLSAVALLTSLAFSGLNLAYALLAIATFAILSADQIRMAWQKQQERWVWAGLTVIALGIVYLVLQDVIQFGRGLSLFIVCGVAIAAWSMASFAATQQKLSIVSRPLRLVALSMPLLAVGIALYRHLGSDHVVWLGRNSLALLLAAGFYFWHGWQYRQRVTLILAALIVNIALMLLWRELSWTDPQFYMIPIGITILALAQLLKDQLPVQFFNPLNYLGALVILVSPTFHIVSGSWLHLFSLMLAAVLIVLAAIGLRLRALMYTGAAFLLADLVAMVVRGSIDHPSLLWLAGLLLGSAVVALGAIAERNRELLMQRMRVFSTALETWH